MSREEIIFEIANETKVLGLAQFEVQLVLETFFRTVKEAVKRGDVVCISHFGTFGNTKYKAGTYKVPDSKNAKKTQVDIILPVRYLVTFLAAPDFEAKTI